MLIVFDFTKCKDKLYYLLDKTHVFNWRDKENPFLLSQSDFILCCLEKELINKGIKNNENDNCLPITFDDFLTNIDIGIDVAPYFKQLILSEVPSYYFATNSESLKRLKNLNLEK